MTIKTAKRAWNGVLMNKSVVMVTAALLAVLACDAASAAGRRPSLSSADADVKVHPFSRYGRAAVLYDQNNDKNSVAIVSQNFEPIYDEYDAQAADDFVVPDGHTWKIKEVDVTGLYSFEGGPAVSENVIFYKNKDGHPGRIVKAFKGVVGIGDGAGSFTIDLGTGVKLDPGRYWVSVQINMEIDVGGQWFWQTRNTRAHKPANWQNPGDGFGTGCTTYAVEKDCISSGQGRDHMFALRGRDTTL